VNLKDLILGPQVCRPGPKPINKPQTNSSKIRPQGSAPEPGDAESLGLINLTLSVQELNKFSNIY
jgi:hypothetical protein